MPIFSKKCLGIDIGAASIKIVEISLSGRRKKLENYVEFGLTPDGSSFETFQGENLLLLSSEVSEVLKGLFKRASIKEKNVALSIPDFSTFFTTFDLPPMAKAEIPQAVEFEARHHILLPLSEVSFDWQIIEKKEVMPGLKLKILLVAVPNNVLNTYQKMAMLSQLKLKGMEAEVFGLIRSSIPKDLIQKSVCIVDLGWQTTTVSIVENKVLRKSHSFDISGSSLTRALAEKLNISLTEAEKLKKEQGLNPERKDILESLLPQINSLAFEIEKVCNNYQPSESEGVENIILSGGSSVLFGLKEYLEGQLKKNIQMAKPFSGISFPSSLKPRLEELSSSFAVAVGVALMGLES